MWPPNVCVPRRAARREMPANRWWRPALASLVLAVVAWLTIADAARAGYIVQPADGTVSETNNPSFLVYLDPGLDSLARVEVASHANASDYGFSGTYIDSCYPSAPFGEPGKFSCQIDTPLPDGTYYWLMTFFRYECQTVDLGFGYTYESCYDRIKHSGPYMFTVQRAKPPADLGGLPTLGGPSDSSRVDARYSSVASVIADRPVTVQCWNHPDWDRLHIEWRRYEGGGDGLSWVLGYVFHDSTVVNLAPDVCARLDLVTYSRKKPRAPGTRLEIAEAFDTLAHESVHAAGVTDEAVTECFSMQLTELVADELGVGYRFGRAMGGLAWRELWPLYAGSEYYTPDCYDGGPLDLYPDTSVWP
jgi:hypothetical protein